MPVDLKTGTKRKLQVKKKRTKMLVNISLKIVWTICRNTGILLLDEIKIEILGNHQQFNVGKNTQYDVKNIIPVSESCWFFAAGTNRFSSIEEESGFLKYSKFFWNIFCPMLPIWKKEIHFASRKWLDTLKSTPV